MDLKKYLSLEIIEQAIQGTLSTAPLRECAVEYLFVMVGGDTPESIRTRIAEVTDLALARGAIVLHQVSAMAIVVWGVLNSQPPPARNALVTSLVKELGSNVKVVHGTSRAHFGNLGSERCMSLSVILPQFTEILAAIARLGFGQVLEVERA
jgi:hypothetical protein